MASTLAYVREATAAPDPQPVRPLRVPPELILDRSLEAAAMRRQAIQGAFRRLAACFWPYRRR